jgi:predicted dehydrogenase
MRFWPGWPWLRERVRDGSLGEVRNASFERLGPPPGWASHFYGDHERSGGALHDMHVHDADFVRWCFGEPETVQATGNLRRVEAEYGYARVAESVRATGGWVDAPGFEFRMRYRVEFADGVAGFAHDRDPPLLLTRDGVGTKIAVPEESAYDAEVRHFANAILEGEPLRASMEDALAVAGLLDREKAVLSP